MGLPDTGAEQTLLDSSFIELLDVHIRAGDYEIFKGVSGSPFLVSYGVIDIELTAPKLKTVYKWSAKVGFMKRPHSEGAIFGHDGFLEYFLASFNGVQHHVTLSPRKRFRPPCMPGGRS
jgi:hypothetical protein